MQPPDTQGLSGAAEPRFLTEDRAPAPGVENPNGLVEGKGERYRRLPTGAHGLAREEVERDQRERLQRAMIELIAQRGYQSVRILDLTKLAHVSRPTFYTLYADKEELMLSAYEDIARRTGETVMAAYDTDGSPFQRLESAMRAFAELAASQPDAMSLFVFGAFGAGSKTLERRNQALDAFERSVEASRDGREVGESANLTVKVILGGIREVAAARLATGRAGELPDISGELARWAASYRRELPEDMLLPPALATSDNGHEPAAEAEPPPTHASERARRAAARLPGGRHDLPREVVEKSQRERIVDATAAIVAAKGLAGLTIPGIASLAGVSHETFYEMYPTKHDAFLGAQKVGLHQAFTLAVEAYEEHKQNDWPFGVAEGLRALIRYMCSEPAHAHLAIVDTFAASPETLAIRAEILTGFAFYLSPGERPALPDMTIPAIAAEAVVGGIWQVLHHYVERKRLADLPAATTQLVYLTLAPFLGPAEAAAVARRPATR